MPFARSRNDYTPRSFSKHRLEEMKASIIDHGLLQNLVVTNEPDETYYLPRISRDQVIGPGSDIFGKRWASGLLNREAHYVEILAALDHAARINQVAALVDSHRVGQAPGERPAR
jgi:hypothetical protein